MAGRLGRRTRGLQRYLVVKWDRHGQPLYWAGELSRGMEVCNSEGLLALVTGSSLMATMLDRREM